MSKGIMKYILIISIIVLAAVNISIYNQAKLLKSSRTEDAKKNVQTNSEVKKYGYIEMLNEINNIGNLKITQIQSEAVEKGEFININVDYTGDYNNFDKVYTKFNDIECLYEVKYLKINSQDKKISMVLSFLKSK